MIQDRKEFCKSAKSMVDTLSSRIGVTVGGIFSAVSHYGRPSVMIAQSQRLGVSLVCCWKHRSFLEICWSLAHSESLKTSVSAKGSAATTGQINSAASARSRRGRWDDLPPPSVICTETRRLRPLSQSLCFFNQSSQDSSGKAHNQEILICGKLM